MDRTQHYMIYYYYYTRTPSTLFVIVFVVIIFIIPHLPECVYIDNGRTRFVCTERVQKAAHGLRSGAPGSPLTPEMQPVRMGGTRTRSVKNRNLHWSVYVPKVIYIYFCILYIMCIYYVYLYNIYILYYI